MDAGQATPQDGLRTAAETYCDAVFMAREDVFETLCHDAFHMVCVDDMQIWDKPAYLARVAARDAAKGTPSFSIQSVESDGDMGRVKLRVEVPGVVYEDYLGFARMGGEWKLINKLFRTYDGPANVS